MRPPVSPIRPTNDDACALARTLIDGARYAALSHVEPETGHPLVSRIGLGQHGGMPLILISQLSSHTSALEADPRCALLIGEVGQVNADKGDPLTHPRLTLIGVAQKITDPGTHHEARTAYLASHPKAKLYVDFADFSFWQIVPQRIALNGGFGKAFALRPSDLTQPKAP